VQAATENGHIAAKAGGNESPPSRERCALAGTGFRLASQSGLFTVSAVVFEKAVSISQGQAGQTEW